MPHTITRLLTTISLALALTLTLGGLATAAERDPVTPVATCDTDHWQPAPPDDSRPLPPQIKPADAMVTDRWQTTPRHPDAADGRDRDPTGRTPPPQPPSG